MIINPLLATDFYKVDHRRQYPEGTTAVYSNFTARTAKYFDGFENFDDKVVVFGIQYFIKDFLIDSFNKNFFQRDKEEVCSEYLKIMDSSLGKGAIEIEHIEKLHDHGLLPLKIKSIDEGERVNIGVPILTIVNTEPEFFWLTNYIETALSAYLWKPITVATIAYNFRKILNHYSDLTIDDTRCKDFVNFQCHDFSFRGMSGTQDASICGAAHLTSFVGTDSICAIDTVNKYYNKLSINGLVGCSVPATEHSVMCAYGEVSEIETFKKLINNIYPSGTVSIVSDSWDFWRVITEYLPLLRDDILRRDGKVVIRPDSGEPVKIICGDPKAKPGSPEQKGAVQCLWETFGGSIYEKGFKNLNSKIGLIYGDSITPMVAEEILKRLMENGFSSKNIVFGVGSYTYQHITRDTLGFAMKSTSCVVNGERKDIFKYPKTDSGMKRSARGLLRVEKSNGEFSLHERQDFIQEMQGELKLRFLNGDAMNTQSFKEIRGMLEVN